MMSGIISLLDFQNVSVVRNNGIVLEDVNFKIHNAELIFILGDSGSGKSSFLKSIYGELDVQGDFAQILDFDLLGIKRKDLQKLRRNLGLIFQDFKVFERLSVYENLNYFLQSINVKNASKRKLAVEQILDKVGLSSYSSKKAYELSGGEKQRLAIARALVHKPKLIIADEPTGNLNKQLGIDVFKLLRDLALEQGTSIITATHDENLPQVFSAKVYRCGEGKLVRN